MAARLLYAIGLPELIAETQDEHEELATDLADSPERLTHIRHKGIEHQMTTPLFGTPRFAGHVEAADAEEDERYYAGLLPDHIETSA